MRNVHDNAAKAGAYGLAIGIRVCQALAAETEDEALAFLSEALVKGEPEGYVRTFVDEGKLLEPLLRKALARGITPEYTARLMSTIAAEEHQSRSVGAASPRVAAPGLVSGRELEILHLIESGLTNRQIADRLSITLSTAKTHVHHISQKLDAKNRTQILARAKNLKLL